MANEDTVLEEALDNLKEAGQRIRATQSLMRSLGMTDGENHRDLLIPNPVVEYTYAKEDRVVASCDHGRVGAPLQESEGPRRTLSPSDRMAAKRGEEDRGGMRGHRLQPRLGAQDSPPLQRAGSGCSGRPSPLQSRRQGEGPAGRGRRGGAARGPAGAAAGLGGRGMWSGPKVARWIAHRNGLEKVHVQRGFEYLRKVGMSPQVPRPSNARAEPSEREAFKKVSPSG